jgi:ABC-2 type transport system ATP-binding protein
MGDGGTDIIGSITAVRKSYGNAFQLGPLDLRLEPGFITAVVGPNGSGKSTLFRMLMGLTQADNGTIRLFGGTYPQDDVAIKRRIGYVPETTDYEELFRTVGDLVAFTASWYPTWDSRRYADLAERFGIGGDQQRIRGMSKGTQRKLALTVALSHQPDLLLLDEPSSGLDPFAWRQMLDELHDFVKQDGKAVLMATHIMDEVKRLADYVVFLYNGRQIGQFEKDALLDEWRLFWVQGAPARLGSLPGVVAVQEGSPTQLLTRSPVETEAALKEYGIDVLRRQPLELDEIFMHMKQYAAR